MLKPGESNTFVLLLIVFLCLHSCANSFKECKTEQQCRTYLKQALDKDKLEPAYKYYNRLVKIKGAEDVQALYKIAETVLENIYSGKINFGSGANFVLWTDNMYKRAKIPFLREKSGMKDFSENLKTTQKLNSFYAGTMLQCDARGDDYLEGKMDLLTNKTSSVRGTAAAMLSNMPSKMYLESLKEVYENDEKLFVRYYALKGLILKDYENYKDTANSEFNKADILGKTIITGALCANGDSSKELILKVAIKQDNEILKARALEGFIYNKKVEHKEQVLTILNSKHMALRLLAAKALAIAGSKEDIQKLKDDIKDKEGLYKLEKAIGLLAIDDQTGIQYIKEAMLSKDINKQMFAAQAIIEHYRRKNGCK